MKGIARWLLRCVLGLLLPLAAAAQPVSVLDDEGLVVSLSAPAQRIVSLAPHTTELLYAAGAGPRVVGTVRYADYPEAARRLPLVGDALGLDIERIAALRPDLIVVWSHGNPPAQIERLRALKVPIFRSEPKRLAEIGDSLRRLGLLAGSGPAGLSAAGDFAAELDRLRSRYSQRPPVRVFYQVWQRPLMTVNGQHLISDVIGLCGGVNVFAGLAPLVPVVGREAVLAAKPQVLVYAGQPGEGEDPLLAWRGLGSFEPLARRQVIALPADLISRQSPRILQAAERLCSGMEALRAPSGPRVEPFRVMPAAPVPAGPAGIR
jgi:iron complex transport system substrate-binding protein